MGEATPFDLEQWLHRGALAARRGDLVTARRIFRALSRLAPHERRVWIGLARVAATAAEREEALRHAGAVSGESLPPELSRVGLPPSLPTSHTVSREQRETPPRTAISKVVSPPLAPRSVDEGEGIVEPTLPLPSAPASARSQRQQRKRQLGWQLPATLLLIAVGLLVASLWLRQPLTLPPIEQLPSLQLPPTLAAIGPLPTPLPTGIVVVTPVVPTPSPPPPTPSPLPTSTPEPDTHALGQLIAYDQWQIGLLRRDDVALIDGGLGAIQPNGRLLVALLAVSNEAPVDRALPATLFAVEDESGQRYYPLPDASRRYLDQLGRGLYGDLALEDTFAAHSGLRSVPVLFELPANRAPVRLWVGGEGWSLR